MCSLVQVNNLLIFFLTTAGALSSTWFYSPGPLYSSAFLSGSSAATWSSPGRGRLSSPLFREVLRLPPLLGPPCPSPCHSASFPGFLLFPLRVPSDGSLIWQVNRCSRALGGSFRVTVNVLVLQSCLTLRDPMDCSPPGSSVHSILQAGILEWVAISFPRGSSRTEAHAS